MSIKTICTQLLTAVFVFANCPLAANDSVSNPATHAIDTTEMIPWNATASVTFSGRNRSLDVLMFPADFPDESHLAVIEAVSYEATVPRGQTIRVRVELYGGDLADFRFFMPPVPAWHDGTKDIFADTQQVRGYAGGGDLDGEAIHAYISRDSSAGEAELTVYASGYFVPQLAEEAMP